jgi:hypothetical protein
MLGPTRNVRSVCDTIDGMVRGSNNASLPGDMPLVQGWPRQRALDRDLARIALLGIVLREERIESLFRRLRARRRVAGLGTSYATVLRWARNVDEMEADLVACSALRKDQRALDRDSIEDELQAIGLQLPWMPPRIEAAFDAWLAEADGRDWEAGELEGDVLSAHTEACCIGSIEAAIMCRGIEDMLRLRVPPVFPPLLRETGPCLRKRFSSVIAEIRERGVLTPSLESLAQDLAPMDDDWLSAFLRVRLAEAGQRIVGPEVATRSVALLPGQTYAEARAEFDRAAAIALGDLGLAPRGANPPAKQRERLLKRIERDVLIWWRVRVIGGPANSIRRVASEVFGDPERRRDVRAADSRAAALLALGDSD